MSRADLLALARGSFAIGAMVAAVHPASAQTLALAVATDAVVVTGLASSGSAPVFVASSAVEGSVKRPEGPADLPRVETWPAAGNPRESRTHLEVGVMPRYISNYFEAQENFNFGSTAPRGSAQILTLSGSLSYDFVRTAQSRITGRFRVRHNFFTDLNNAETTEYDAMIEYKSKPDEFRLELYRRPSRLASIVNGQNVFSDTNRARIEYHHHLTDKLRVGGNYEFSRETYPTAFRDHDISTHQVLSDVQYEITPWLQPGFGIEYERGNGRSDNFTYDQVGPVLELNSSLWPIAYMGVSYKWYDRKYRTGDALASNYLRVDKRKEVSFYGTAWLGKGWSLFGFAYYTEDRSNQPWSNFHSYDAGLGLFYRFP